MGNSGVYTLRGAEIHDLHFLFGVTIAVRQSKEIFDWGEAFHKFKANFKPDKIQVIRHQNRDVGRLRVERSAESIYVGGIQLLPAFQGKGIGTAIFADLIQESERTGVPINLEVYNKQAFKFYLRRGFVHVGKIKNARKLIRQPRGE